VTVTKPADRIAALLRISVSQSREFLARVQSRLTRSVSHEVLARAIAGMSGPGKSPSVEETAAAVVSARPPGGEVALRPSTEATRRVARTVAPAIVPAASRPPAVAPPKSVPVQVMAGPDPENVEAETAFGHLEGPTDAIFITGRAGTGKSYLLKYWAKKTRKRIVVVAPTGLAAMNVGGQTIHSFFRFPPRLLNKGDVGAVTDPGRRALYRAVDTIVIDEVSMVNANMVDMIDHFMRLNGRDRLRPFGGAQVVMFGDPYQLPPVVATEEEAKFFATNFRSRHFFDARIFEELPVRAVELRKNYRQKDGEFMDLLGGVRQGQLSRDHEKMLNARCRPGFVPPGGESWLTLTTTNRRAAELNSRRLATLRGVDSVYEATVEGKLPNEKNLPADATLRLRPGAQVIFVRNDSEKRWVNGTFGRVVKATPTCVEVEVSSGGSSYRYSLERETWESFEFRFDPKTNRIESTVVGKFTQYPIRQAWAITIHKSQGQTLEKIVVDLDGGAFEHGQVYVALSRCPRLDGIVLDKEIWPNDLFRVDSRVLEFMEATSWSRRD